MKLQDNAKYEGVNGNNPQEDKKVVQEEKSQAETHVEEVNLEEMLSDNKEGFDVSLNDLMSVANINENLSDSNDVELL